MILLAGVGGYAIAGYTAAPATQQAPAAATEAPQPQEAPPATQQAQAPEDDWEAWEREYDAQQKQEERERKLTEKQAEAEAKREKQDRDRQYAEQKKAEAARQAQLPPTSATFEALLRKSKSGSSTPELQSDLFWLRDQVKEREGLQSVLDACDRAYGGTLPSYVARPTDRASVCHKQSGEYTL